MIFVYIFFSTCSINTSFRQYCSLFSGVEGLSFEGIDLIPAQLPGLLTVPRSRAVSTAE